MDAYRRYGPALLRKCRRMLQNQQDAEDMVQGLFTDMLAKGVREPDLPYLYRAVTNRCINHLRYAQNRRRLLKDHDMALRGPTRIHLDDRAIGIDLLCRLAARLDAKTLAVLIYRYFDDMNQEEIARLEGVSRRAIGKRLKKIERQAREILQHTNGGES